MDRLKNIWFQLTLVFILALLQYANTRNHDYAWDDAIVLTENTRVQKGLSDIPELFENRKSAETQNRYGYRPIALLSFATDVELFGMDPAASHKVSMVYYGILCMLVLLFLQALFPDSGWRNFLLTLLFVAHPLHTEVVANIKSRDEVLAMGFGLVALLFYRKALLGRPLVFFGLSGLFILLAFHSKESAVTFCGVACLLPWYVTTEKDRWAKLKSCMPAVTFVLILLSFRLYAYSSSFFQSDDFELYLKGLFHHDQFVGNPISDSGLGSRLAMAFYLIPYFLYRFLMPYPLLHDYSYNQFPPMTWGDWQVWVAVIFCVALLVWGIRGAMARRPYGFGVLFFLLTSSVYLHLVEVAPDIFAERFVFVPSLGIIIALIWFYDRQVKPIYLNVVVCLMLIPMAAYTWNRNEAWKDNRTLLETDLPLLTDCVRANYNYAIFLHAEYYRALENEKPEIQRDLLKHYERALSLTDRLFNVYLDLGSAYMEFGEPAKAYEVFTRATQKYPNLSAPFVQMGKYHMSFKEYEQAIPYFKKALQNGAQNSDYHYLLSICLFNSGAQDEAIEIMKVGEKLGVSSSAYHALMAQLYTKMNMQTEALHAVNRGITLYPKDQGLRDIERQLKEDYRK